MSLVSSINNNTFTYGKLTKKILDDTIKKVFSKTIKQNRFVAYTNLVGYISYEISMLSEIYNVPKVYYYVPKRSKYHLVISIGNKNSLIKCYYKNNKFEIKKGSELLFIHNSIGIETFKKIKKYD